MATDMPKLLPSCFACLVASWGIVCAESVAQTEQRDSRSSARVLYRLPVPRKADSVREPTSVESLPETYRDADLDQEADLHQSVDHPADEFAFRHHAHPPGTSGGRAMQECDSHKWMSPYLHRADDMARIGNQFSGDAQSLPVDYRPWWDVPIRSDNGKALGVGVDWLIHSALQHSPSVKAVSTEPRISESLLVEESAEFDWRTFLETTYDDFNDPVGSTLTTGNNDDRFVDKNWSGSGGMRRRNGLGGEFEFSQRLGRQSNNSVFLIPNPQGTTRLELNYTQPLLNGAGRAYNQSQIVLARITRNSSQDEVLGTLQEHLLKVTEAYWELYRSHARFHQRSKLLQQAIEITRILSDREKVDALPRQILRAKAAVAKRRSEIARNRTEVRNAGAQLRLLVNHPQLVETNPHGLIPLDPPIQQEVSVSVSDSLATALRHRADISQAIRSMRAANVRLGVTKNEILPRLDLLVSSYVAGLEGQSQVFRAWENQFADGRPGISIGLQYEIPVGNRAAMARHRRREWELIRSVNQFQSVVESALTEVELAAREVETTYREMVGKYQAMIAARDETHYLDDRFRVLPGVNDSATLLLENLLESQERLADEEAAFVDAQVQYSISIVGLRKTMGTLLRCNSREPENASPGTTGMREAKALLREIQTK